MCGRLILTSPAAVLAQLFDLLEVPADLPPRYNLAPRQTVAVLRSPRRLELLRWGLTMPDPKHAGINARVESLGRAMYREKVRDSRCVVVADGFYEWRREGGRKQPYLVTRTDRAPMLLAGIYDAFGGVAVITTVAKGAVATLHDRMPVTLEREALATWLDPSRQDVAGLLASANLGATPMALVPVSDRANSIRNDDPSLLEAIDEQAVQHRRGETLPLFG